MGDFRFAVCSVSEDDSAFCYFGLSLIEAHNTQLFEIPLLYCLRNLLNEADLI